MEELLRKNGLKRTPTRINILKYMGGLKYAVSTHEIENYLGDSADRVTVYRIIKAFEEKGIIHKVIDTKGKTKFALCTKACTANFHKDDHVHFTCIRCRQTYCLYDIPFPSLELPEGYLSYTMLLCVEGICNDCALF